MPTTRPSWWSRRRAAPDATQPRPPGDRGRLSGEDAGFLYLDQPTQPLNCMSLALLSPETGPAGRSGVITQEYLRRHVAQRLDVLPFLRWRVCRVPFRLHHPVYVDDVGFSLDRQVGHVTLPAPGTPAQLERLCGDLVQQHFDPDHPMWQIILVDGLEDGRQAVVTRLHHSLMDGAAAMLTYPQLFSPEIPLSDAALSEWLPHSPPSRWQLVTSAMRDQVASARRVPRLISMTVTNVRALNRHIKQSAVRVPKTPQDTPFTMFSNAFTPAQIAVHTDLELADLLEIRDASGVSRNDVVLGIVAGAVRGYLCDRAALPDAALLAIAPMSVPTPGNPGRMHGNHILAFSTSLATDVLDPWERLKVISTIASESKGNLTTLDPELLCQWLDIVPPAVARVATTFQYRQRRKDQTVVDQNLVVSHFRGPDHQWKFGSSNCDAFYWFGPPNQGVGLNLSLWSYAGQMLVGIQAFADALAEPEDLVRWLHRSTAELLALARAHPGAALGNAGNSTGIAS